MIGHRFIIRNVKYDVLLKLVGFRFTKFKFENTSMTFLFDWTLRLGIIAISKWQTKSFNELKKMSDIAWNKKWKKERKKGGEIIEDR